MAKNQYKMEKNQEDMKKKLEQILNLMMKEKEEKKEKEWGSDI